MTTGQFSRVFLTGLSGSGKSTVARLVADALGWDRIDTDASIEEAEGRSIAEIFASGGEEQFRALERKEITGAAALDNVVVATGGGAILDIGIRRSMALGLVVWLHGPPQTLAARLSDTGKERPLLAGGKPEERLAEMQAQRSRYYALADVHIDIDKRTPSQVADAVVEAVRENDPWFASHPDRLLLPEERSNPPASEPAWVEGSSRRYPAYVSWGLLDRMGELLREAGLEGTAYVISDSEVLPRHGDRVLHSLRTSGFETAAFAITAGEANKTLDTAATVYDWLVAQRAERGATLIALGGGVVGDLVGFVAATYLRGVPLVQAPTSLLAMVDASIGGKVAVDHKEGKNLIGAFYQPRLVAADVSTLKTLPQRLLIEGCAEAIKHALILDPKLLDDLEAHAGDLLHVEPTLAVDIVRRNVAIKAAVIAEDERDTGRRAILNYGHTIGHAIEAAAGYQIGHGAADAIGMTAAAKIGLRLGVTPEALVDRQRAVLELFGLPTKGPKLDVESVLAAMTLDKKVAAGVVNWVLLEEAGSAAVRSDVPEALVREVVEQIVGDR